MQPHFLLLLLGQPLYVNGSKDNRSPKRIKLICNFPHWADVIGEEGVTVELIGQGFGDFKVGSHPVRYVARDSAGNEAFCDIVIVVQGKATLHPVTL